MNDVTRVLLVDYQGRLFSNLQSIKNNQIVLPIGPMYLSAYLKFVLNNVEVKLLKSQVDFSNEKDLLVALNEFRPDIIGIRCLSLDKNQLFKDVAYIRKCYIFDSYKIVLGGPIASSNTQEVQESELFDYVITGEGERVFAEIVKSFKDRKEVLQNVNGIVNSEGFYTNDVIENLDDMPFPDYSLIDFTKYDQYVNYGYNRNRQGVVFTSRGCPYKCIYCHNISPTN